MQMPVPNSNNLQYSKLTTGNKTHVSIKNNKANGLDQLEIIVSLSVVVIILKGQYDNTNNLTECVHSTKQFHYRS
jgi:hypothetical protein